MWIRGAESKLLRQPTFDVSMQLVVVVQVAKAHEQLLQDDGDFSLCYAAGLHQVCATAARTKLHDDPQVGAVQIRAIVLCDIGRVHAREDGNLGDDVVDLVLGILDIDDLDGDRLAGPAVNASTTVSTKLPGRGKQTKTYPLYTLPKLPPPVGAIGQRGSPQAADWGVGTGRLPMHSCLV